MGHSVRCRTGRGGIRRERRHRTAHSTDPVIRDCDARDSHVSNISHDICIGERVAHCSIIALARRLHHAQFRRKCRVHLRIIRESRKCCPVGKFGVERGRIHDRAGIHIGLGDRVLTGTGRGLSRGQSGQRAIHGANQRIRNADIRECQIARIRNIKFKDENITGLSEGRGDRAFFKCGLRLTIAGGGHRIGWRNRRAGGRIARGVGRVDDFAGIHIRLGDGIARRTDRRLCRREGRHRTTDRTDERVIYAHTHQGHIACILQIKFVINCVANHRKGRCRGALLKGECGLLIRCHGHACRR